MTNERGTLYLVATPIGNLEDISLRALRILKEVDRIACEDTRRTIKLLAHYGITTPRESYHEHNEATRTPQLLAMLEAGKNIALVADAGTPLISDPGFVLVWACRHAGIPVVPIPGPSAALTALSGSGLPADSFLFVGFLPARAALRKKRLCGLLSCPATLIFYEAPHRILSLLADMIEILGPRPACLARELTKVHEEWIHGTLADIFGALKARPRIRGEITLVVRGGEAAEHPVVAPASLGEHLEQEMRATGATRKEALKAVARRRGISRKMAYRLLLGEK